jgi:glutamyl/glutaminyl-tRNA synthetase
MFVGFAFIHTHVLVNFVQNTFCCLILLQFDLRRVQRGGAIVDYDRLRWMNQKYIRQRIQNDMSGLLELMRPYVNHRAHIFAKSYHQRGLFCLMSSLVRLILKAFPNANVSDSFLGRVVRMHEVLR